MATEEKTAAAVYAPWATFKGALDRLSQGVPNQIDRTVFAGMAWSVQSQVLAGLKFLGLTDEKGKPTPMLHKLASKDEDARKEALKTVLSSRYGDLVGLDLTKATLAQVNEQMTTSYNVSGETREKAVRFFLSAAEYADIPLSTYLKPKSGAGNVGGAGSPRKRRAISRPRPAPLDEAASPPPPAGSSGTTRVVNLKSGGTLTLAATIDVLRLIPADRKFVFDLIDKLEEYEASNPSEESPAPDEEGGE